jgi:hypothetical protein
MSSDSPPGSTLSTFDLLDAFEASGCPVCQLSLRSVSRFMGSMNYDSVNDPGFREQLRAARGFCNPHAYQWLHSAFILGTAKIYRDFLKVIAADLRIASFEAPTISKRLSTFLGGSGISGPSALVSPPSRSCPACLHMHETETLLTTTLVQGLGDAGFRDRYTESAGLCRPHLGPALAAAPTQEIFETLRDLAVQREEALIRQLNEVIRKHDYRYQDEVAGEERGSAHRAVAHAIGAHNALPVLVIDD